MTRASRMPVVRWPLLALLTLSGFLIIVASSLGSKVEYLPPLELGLLAVLPAPYFIGIGLMALSLVLGLNSKNEACFFFQALLLYLGIWGARFLFTANPTIWDSYMHYFSSLQMVVTGTTVGEGVFSYSANYPGFFLVGAIYSLLASPDALALLQYWPLFTASLTVLSLYLFVRTYLSRLDKRLALLVILLGNVWLSYHYSPTSVSFPLGLLVFVFLEKQGFRWLLLALASFLFITISHPTTSFFIMLGLIGRQLIILIRVRSAKVQRREVSWPVLQMVIIWIAWLVTGARQYSTFLFDLIYKKMEYIFFLPEATSETIIQRTSQNMFVLGPMLRLAVLGMLGLLIIVTIYLHLRRRRKRHLPGTILALALVSMAIVPLDIFFLQGQLYDRGFLYFVLAATVLVSVVVFYRWTAPRKIAAVLLALAAVVACSSIFYQDSLMTVSTEALAFSDFVDESMPRGSLVVGGAYPEVVWRESNWTSFTRAQYYNVYDEPFSNVSLEYGPTAMVFDRTTLLWMTQWGQLYIYDYYLSDAGNQSKVYENGAYMMIYGGVASA